MLKALLAVALLPTHCGFRPVHALSLPSLEKIHGNEDEDSDEVSVTTQSLRRRWDEVQIFPVEESADGVVYNDTYLGGEWQNRSGFPSRHLQQRSLSLCSYHGKGDWSEGYEFEARTSFAIVGFRVFNIGSLSTQSVQLALDQRTEFYARSEPADRTIAANICVYSGQKVTLLGRAGGYCAKTSWCSTRYYTAYLEGRSVYLKGVSTRHRIHSSPARTYSRDLIGRVYLYYRPSCFTKRPTPRPTKRPTPRPTKRPTPRPTTRPTARPSAHPTISMRPTSRPSPASCTGLDRCGNCNEHRADETGCNCPSCEDDVCSRDDHCCSHWWDRDCAMSAEILCDCIKSNPPSEGPSNLPSTTFAPTSRPTVSPQPSVSAHPTMVPSTSPSDATCNGVGSCGDCDKAHTSAGCGCKGCEFNVCNKDPHCCMDSWDRQCVRHAEELCTCLAPSAGPSLSTSPSKRAAEAPTPLTASGLGAEAESATEAPTLLTASALGEPPEERRFRKMAIGWAITLIAASSLIVLCACVNLCCRAVKHSD